LARMKQRQYNNLVERFLTAHVSARYLCRHVGMADLANVLVPLFGELQDAHERLVNGEANRFLIQIIKSIRRKMVSVDQVREMFQLDRAALITLLNHLDAPPRQDLAKHLSNTTSRHTKTHKGKYMTKASNPVRRLKKHVPKVPYFARRMPSKAFRKLDRTWKTGRGTDATQAISEDREDRL